MHYAVSAETLIDQIISIIGVNDPALKPIYIVFACMFLFLIISEIGKILISVLGHGK